MKNKDCEIIQDLLFGYVDDVLNAESKKMVEKHLEECTDCKKKLDLIKNDIKENESKKNNSKKIDYLKKIRRKGKIKTFIIVFILMFIILVVGIHTVRNMVIFKKIDENQTKYSNLTNYHIIASYYSGKQYVVNETYRKNDIYLSSLTRYNNESGLIKMTFYISKEEHRMYLEVKTNTETSKKVYFPDNNGDMFGILTMDTYGGEGHIYSNLIIDSFLTRISSSDCNGKECYILEGKYLPWMLYDGRNTANYSYIEKETGLFIRGSNGITSDGLGGEFDAVQDWFYEFDNVTDEDVTPPDIADYEITEVK